MPYAIPASVVTSAIDLAVRRGWDVKALLTEAGVSPMRFTTPGPRLTDEQVLKLARVAWRMTDDDFLGVAPHPVPRGTLRMMCFAMASVPNLREGIIRFAEFSRAIPGIPSIRLEVVGKDATVAIDTAGLDDSDHLLTTVVAAATQRVIGWAIGKRVPVRRVELPFARPDNVADLDLVFGTTLRFDSPTTAVVLHRDALAAPIMHDEVSLLRYLKNAPTALLHDSTVEESVSCLVRRAVEKGLRERTVPTAERLAQQLAMSPPTLRRKLRTEGTSLRQVRDDILRHAAITSLRRGEEPVGVLAQRLGFSEPSAFTRAFRRWTGYSPSAYRAGRAAPL